MSSKWNKKIDQFLNNELQDSELDVFKKEISSNPELQKEIELHKTTIKMIKRKTLRNLVNKSGKKFHLKKKIVNGGIIILVLAVLGSVYLYIHSQNTNSNAKNTSALTKKEQFFKKIQQSLAFKNIKPQYFEFDGKSNVFLSNSGVLLSVTPKSFFLNNSFYSGKAIIQWQEARTPAQIMKAGLSTKSNDSLLETQGMFAVSAFTPEGKQLKISKKGIYVQMPVDSLKTGMKLFAGKMKSNGDVNWINPQNLNRIPKQVNMTDLDLYPINYEPTLNKLKWYKSKEKRDSLYLTFESFELKNTMKSVALDIPYSSQNLQEGFINWNTQIENKKLKKQEAITYKTKKNDFVHPSKVLAIWNKKYNGTLIATKEFGERMPYIHNTCDNSVLQLYIDHLDLPMWKIDEMVVKKGYPKFKRFVNEKVGKLEIDSTHQKNLDAFFQKAEKHLRKLGISSIQKQLEMEHKWDQKTDSINSEYYLHKGLLQSKNYGREWMYNMKNVLKQLHRTIGYYLNNSLYINSNTLICNVDRFVTAVTTNRKSGSYSDPNNGRTAKIIYQPFSVSIQNHNKFKELYMYFCPKQLNSYERVNFKNGKLNYNLNADIKYSGVIIGMNENGFFLKRLNLISPMNIGSLKLKKLSQQEFEDSLNHFNKKIVNNTIDLSTELGWLFRKKEDYSVMKKRRNMQTFRKKVGNSISSCWEQKIAVSNYTIEKLYYGKRIKFDK